MRLAIHLDGGVDYGAGSWALMVRCLSDQPSYASALVSSLHVNRNAPDRTCSCLQVLVYARLALNVWRQYRTIQRTLLYVQAFKVDAPVVGR